MKSESNGDWSWKNQLVQFCKCCSFELLKAAEKWLLVKVERLSLGNGNTHTRCKLGKLAFPDTVDVFFSNYCDIRRKVSQTIRRKVGQHTAARRVDARVGGDQLQK